jgi:NAD-dependent SIR2 family protein deacetylase
MSLARVAKILKNSSTQVVFLTGAGTSVSAGIPDFRSPGGMYDTLKPELLTATESERKAMTKSVSIPRTSTSFYSWY